MQMTKCIPKAILIIWCVLAPPAPIAGGEESQSVTVISGVLNQEQPKKRYVFFIDEINEFKIVVEQNVVIGTLRHPQQLLPYALVLC